MTKEEQIKGLIGKAWYDKLKDEFDKPYFSEINKVLASGAYYPEKHNVFRAFMATGFNDVRIVILGQDPYHDGQATGVAFETKGKMNPSLQNILDGMDDDLQIGDYLAHQHKLSYLCDRGVLLINSALTVAPGPPKSHSALWKPWTEAVFQVLNTKESPVIFLLWGRDAQYYKKFLDPFKHTIVECEHPAAASYAGRPWEHHECFSQAQGFVERNYGEHYRRIW